MTRRINALLRDYVDLLAWSAEVGQITTYAAACRMAAAGVPVKVVNKVKDGRPHIVDIIKNEEIVLVINTVDEKRQAIADSRSIRTSALDSGAGAYSHALPNSRAGRSARTSACGYRACAIAAARSSSTACRIKSAWSMPIWKKA